MNIYVLKCTARYLKKVPFLVTTPLLFFFFPKLQSKAALKSSICIMIVNIVVVILIQLVVLVNFSESNITQQPQVSRTCLTISTILNNAACCKSSMLPFTFNFFSQSFNLSNIFCRAPIIAGTTTTCLKNSRSSFFPILIRCNCLPLPILSS